MRVYAHFEDFGEKEELRAARKQVRFKVTQAIREAGQRVILPLAKRAAPGIAAHYLTTKATTKGAYITTIGPRRYDNITGLVNFGGPVFGQIKPKRAQALQIAGTPIVVASVGEDGKLRARYRGKHFLEAAIDAGVPEMERLAERNLMEAFEGV